MKISQKGFDLIEKWEGFKSYAYQDVVGVWTIGYGTTRYATGQKVQRGDKITVEQARKLLYRQAQAMLDEASPNIKVELNQNQIDAIGSFIYNLGVHAFNSSTLLKLINAKDPKASDQFDRWVHAGGKKVQGLVNRRAEEKKLFLEKI